VRELRYQTIAGELRSRLTAGEFVAGRLLPSESELSAAYGASRVTIRKALDELRGEGLVDARQGFGWFVAGEPVRQQLGRLGTIEDQLAASGIVPERRVLEFAFVAASRRAQLVLGVDSVLRVRRLNLADGHPFARVTVWVPETLAYDLSRADVEGASFYELLARPKGRRPALVIAGATQTIGAAAASASDATLLEIPAGSPVLRCERITRTSNGTAVLLAEHVFAAAHTQFVVELPSVDASMAPSGLRLVE
jgi:GntR family transcriptional regulator